MITETSYWESLSFQADISIFIDGKQLNEIFAAFKHQIDSLKHKQQLMSKTSQPTVDNSDLLSNFKAMQARFSVMETKLQIVNDLEVRLGKLEKSLDRGLNEIRNETKENIDELRLNQVSNTERIEKLEKISDEMQNQINEIKNTPKRNNVEESAIYSLKDVISINEHRLNKVERQVVENHSSVIDLRDNLKTFPKVHLEGINEAIVKLLLEKADKKDLHLKADESLIKTKAEKVELEKLFDQDDELERRISSLGKDIEEGFDHINSSLTKKTEYMGQWCLSQLRKEIENLLNSRNTVTDGTNIGKVKCLVCDQEVVQHPVTEIVFGGPKMMNMIPMQRPRSPSIIEPKDSPDGREVDPQQITRRSSTRGKSFTQLPQVGQRKASQSKLVKLDATPEVRDPLTMNNLVEKDFVTDITHRLSVMSQSPIIGSNTQSTPNQQSHTRRTVMPGQMESALSHKNLKFSHELEQQQQQYFKDLEERFTGGRRFNNSGSMKQFQAPHQNRRGTTAFGSTVHSNTSNNSPFSNRPSSAPIRPRSRTEVVKPSELNSHGGFQVAGLKNDSKELLANLSVVSEEPSLSRNPLLPKNN